MKSRQEIKALAKEAFGNQRANAIVICLIIFAFSLVGSFVSYIPYIGFIISIAASCVLTVLTVSSYGQYTKIYRGESSSIDGMMKDCGNNFMRKLGGMLWMGLFVFLWALLLYIPGIVKAYAYMLSPYILAEYPDVTAKDALKISMKMTKGYKGELFVMHLSFIGWSLLSCLTFGILAIVYVGPYMSTTQAGYYTELRDRAIAAGVVTKEELGVSAIAG